MKKERKENLIYTFPAVPYNVEMEMDEKRKARNLCVFLARNNTVYVRCYHRYCDGRLLEVQRYVFAKDGAVRYGVNYKTQKWEIRKEFSEPKFYRNFYGYCDNSYIVLNLKAINETFLKYSLAEKYTGTHLIEYLKFYIKHPNAEYLMKTGYGNLVKDAVEKRWMVVNWKSNNLLKMLNLSKNEFKLLQGQEHLYTDYLIWRNAFPGYTPETLINFRKKFNFGHILLKKLSSQTGLSAIQIYNYLNKNDASLRDYRDYIEECDKLKYDVKSSQISRPKDFYKAHERTSAFIIYQTRQSEINSLKSLKPERKCLEFSYENLLIRQPEDINEIIAEGRKLNHCVGGYAQRHALGKLHIMFIRARDKPNIPYYTVEIDTTGTIIQVKGFKNTPMNDEISEFIEMYKLHLAKIFNKKERKPA